MKIAIIGATGKAGQQILKEAISRNMDVTAIVRNASKVTEDVKVIEKEVLSLTSEDVAGFDVVVNAFGAGPGNEKQHEVVGKHLIDIFNGLSTRLIVVGGAGSLFADEAKTVRVFETPDFPEAFFATAFNQNKNLSDLEQSSIIWTFISPSAFFDPEGPRTGEYATADDHLVINSEGNSYVSYADYALALVDEIENGAYVNKRFTVGSK